MVEGLQLITFSQATDVRPLGAGCYRAMISDAYVVGQVPCGGYVATCLLEAISEHMRSRSQPDALCAHFEFLDRTVPGAAVIIVEEVKLGRQLSTVHVALYQGHLLTEAPWVAKGESSRKLVAYVTCFNINLQKGLTLKTSYTLSNPPPPVDLESLAREGSDEHWVPYGARSLELPGFEIRLWDNLEFYVPRRGQYSHSVVDFWLRLRCGEAFTNASLAFVADTWPHIIDGYRASPGQEADYINTIPATSIYWYPTVVLNLDIKQGLPPRGSHWLRMRSEAKEIRDGKLDLETLIYDQDGNLAAISQHVDLVLSADRNLSKRKVKSRI
ncbi:thioesterase-like superfamily-domain-containing protein [Xylaria arbuscula]|nr:thioesterase-like superfamily-domain-containing protein [Xylaria arbuscula]